jgi:glycosyltransferase involved in cell wall biosynthesis
MDEIFQPKEYKFKYSIAAFRSDMSSCWYHRLHTSLAFLKKNYPEYKIAIYDYMSRDQFPTFDLAILQRQYNPRIYEMVLEMKNLGKKVVYEVDDLLFPYDGKEGVPSWSPAYTTFGRKDIQESIKKTIGACDAMFVSTEYLKKAYSNHCKKIYVLPNSIIFDVMSPSPNNSAKKVVCWQGSSTHGKDLRIIERAIKHLVDDGYFVKTIGAEVSGAYQVPSVEFKSFYQMFSQLDACVGLAPLIPIPFNRAKSNLKFLEYSAQRIATVASNFGPYADTIIDGETGLLVSDNKDWYDKIKYLLDNDDIRSKMIDKAYDYVRENFDITKNYIYWKNAVDEILEERNIVDIRKF